MHFSSFRFPTRFAALAKGFFYWPLARGGEGGGKEERIFQCGKKRGKGKKKKKKKTAHEDEMLAGKSGFFGFFFRVCGLPTNARGERSI